MELNLITKNGKALADSRDVAEMIDRPHNDLMKTIRVYINYLGQGDFSQSKFFIESTYLNSQKKEQPCFLITKKGCDMIANKLSGVKGVTFTAAYVTKFEEMEKQIQEQSKPSYMINDPIKRAETWIIEQREKEQVRTKNLMLEQRVSEYEPKATYYDMVLQNKSLLTISKIAKDYGMSAVKFNKLLYELGVQYKQGGVWLLYQRHADKGYTQSKTHIIDADNSKLHTQWTQKGRLFIYDLLKSRKGILPIIERGAEDALLTK